MPARIAVVGRGRPYPGGPLPEEPFIAEGLREAGTHVDVIDVHGVPPDEALRRIGRYSSDVLLATHACVTQPIEFWEGLGTSRQHKRVVLWTPDLVLLPGRPEQYAERAAFCDLVLHPANVPVPGVPHAAYFCAAATLAEGTAQAVEWSTRKFDRVCAFIGTPYDAARQQVVADLRKAFRKRFEVISPMLGNGIYGPDLARFCSRTKVIVGLNARDDVPGYWSDRMYQVPAHGGFLLATASPGIENHLRPGKHFAPLPDPEKVVAEVRRWSKADTEREAIRVAGFQHVREHHTWQQRGRELLLLLERKGMLSAPSGRSMFRFVVPVYNSRDWVGKCLDSIRRQTIRNWRCVVVDDRSTDGTWEMVQRVAGSDDRFDLVQNPRRQGALANIIQAIDRHAPDLKDVIVTVDGDDWLAHERVLERLLAVYRDPRVQLTYGQFRQQMSGHVGWCREFPPEVKAARSYRVYDWIATHLRTFRYGLWRQIRRRDLNDSQTGKPWEMAWDVAMMMPMLEMCEPDQAVFIPEVLYAYNDLNPINDHKVDAGKQRDMHRRILALPSYAPVGARA